MKLDVVFKSNLLQNFIRIQNDEFDVKVIDEQKIEIYNIESLGLDREYDEEHKLLMFKDSNNHYSRIPIADIEYYELYKVKDNK